MLCACTRSQWFVQYKQDGTDHLVRERTPEAAIETASRLLDDGAMSLRSAWGNLAIRSDTTKSRASTKCGSGLGDHQLDATAPLQCSFEFVPGAEDGDTCLLCLAMRPAAGDMIRRAHRKDQRVPFSIPWGLSRNSISRLGA